MIGPGAMRILPSFPPLHLLLPLPPPQPLLPPRLPLTTLLPSLSRPVLEQSGAPPLVRRVRSGASRRSPPPRSVGASRRPMKPEKVTHVTGSQAQTGQNPQKTG